MADTTSTTGKSGTWGNDDRIVRGLPPSWYADAVKGKANGHAQSTAKDGFVRHTFFDRMGVQLNAAFDRLGMARFLVQVGARPPSRTHDVHRPNI